VNRNYTLVAERAAHRCEYCHAPEAIFNVRCEVDHILPISKGGPDEPDNLALACRACNLWKLDAVKTENVPLFNPRRQNWPDHFELDVDASFKLVGKTAVGQATIQQLKLNAPLQLVARAQWIVLDIFP
jgi:5-methylcytosine-specific restriction endonuclease McrA